MSDDSVFKVRTTHTLQALIHYNTLVIFGSTLNIIIKRAKRADEHLARQLQCIAIGGGSAYNNETQISHKELLSVLKAN